MTNPQLESSFGGLLGIGAWGQALTQQEAQFITTTNATNATNSIYLMNSNVGDSAHPRPLDERDWLRGRIREIEWRGK